MFNQKKAVCCKTLKKRGALYRKIWQICERDFNPATPDIFKPNSSTGIPASANPHQIIGGNVPTMNSGQQSGSQQNLNNQQTLKSENYVNNSTAYKNDSFICSDLLSMEKYVSATYNTSIFQIKDKAVRNALNHIQKEEQEHGEKLYNYMAKQWNVQLITCTIKNGSPERAVVLYGASDQINLIDNHPEQD